jgi:hypothetical protein
MIWRRFTLVALATCTVLCGWVYLRDRGGAVLREPQRVQAQLDANRMLTALAGSQRCGADCTARVLERVGPTRWRVNVIVRGSWRCFAIDVAAFGQTVNHGFSGLRATSCGRRTASDARN